MRDLFISYIATFDVICLIFAIVMLTMNRFGEGLLFMIVTFALNALAYAWLKDD